MDSARDDLFPFHGPALDAQLARLAAVNPDLRAKRNFSVRLKIMLAFVAACATVLAFTAVVIQLQLNSIERAAQLEASNLARSVAYGASLNASAIQPYVEGLDDLYKRDLFIVDASQRTVADVNARELGEVYADDPTGEVADTLKDGHIRVFIETSIQHPHGAKQIVVPLYSSRSARAAITGAVVLEYTDIRRELLEAGLGQIRAVGVAGLLCATLIGLFGWRLGNSVSDRLKRLQLGVQRVSQGDYGRRIPASGTDEIGALTLAFNGMTDELQLSHARLTVERQKERESAAQIEYLAYNDKLTGLANRSMFSKTLEQCLKETQRYERQLAVFFIDLDRFKNFNDTLGHEAGDQLLKEVASRLKSCLRESDTVARLGGDEFVIILPSLNDPEHLAAVAQKILVTVAQPFNLNRQEFRVTASIGISVYPGDGEDERSLMKNADIAMYQAKEDGKNNYAFYSEALNRHSVERLAFESDLQRALAGNQFQVHYQPKVDCRTGEINGVEALLRWNHPDLGPVSPVKFIPIAEETGLIVAIGRWVLATACRQQVDWIAQGLPPLRMAVNLSARQFSDDGLLQDVRDILAQTGMAPECLELEITESMLMLNVDKASEVLMAFKSLGISLSVDDFGTGYSSLSNLKRFPVSTIKIDRSFIRELPANTEDQAIAQAIIVMGKTLNMTVVAEGVETWGQAQFLRDNACDELQGFYFSKAVPAPALAELVRERAWVAAATAL